MEKILVVERDKLLGGKPLLYGFHNQNLDELLENIYRFSHFVDRPDAENNPALKQIIPYLLISHKNNTADPLPLTGQGSVKKSREGRGETPARPYGRSGGQESSPVRDEHKLFLVQRLAAQTEKRLHNKYSIGIGGHINPVTAKDDLPPPEADLPASPTCLGSPEGQRGEPQAQGSKKKTATEVEDIIKSGLERELHEELKVSTSYQYKLVGYLNDDTNSVGQVHFGLVFQVMVNDENGVEVAENDLMVGKFVNIKEIEKHFSLLESWSQIVYKDFVKHL